MLCLSHSPHKSHLQPILLLATQRIFLAKFQPAKDVGIVVVKNQLIGSTMISWQWRMRTSCGVTVHSCSVSHCSVASPSAASQRRAACVVFVQCCRCVAGFRPWVAKSDFSAPLVVGHLVPENPSHVSPSCAPSAFSGVCVCIAF